MPSWLTGRRRIIAAVATLVAFGGIITVTQVSNASTTPKKQQNNALAACDNIAAPAAVKLSTQTRKGTYTANGATQHPDDGAGVTVSAATLRARCRTWVMQNVGNKGGTASTAPTTGATSAATSGGGTATTAPTDAATTTPAATATTVPPGAGLDILSRGCDTSTLPAHTGFQDGNRCVSTEFGEVGLAANNPSLLITKSPPVVKVDTPFTLVVSTRNLIRDRFLAAGAGGYYVEASVLNNGIERGHFHTACRMLDTTTEAPDPSPVPAFFVATEDSKGSATPDSVTISVPGLPTSGTAQCASWAGDGSHRIPMMQRANELPAFDSVRVRVTN